MAKISISSLQFHLSFTWCRETVFRSSSDMIIYETAGCCLALHFYFTLPGIDITTTTTTAALEITTEIPNINGENSKSQDKTTKVDNSDIDEFGQPRLIERMSMGKKYLVSNPLFKGSEMNAEGEKTHMVFEKDGVRNVFPDGAYREFVYHK